MEFMQTIEFGFIISAATTVAMQLLFFAMAFLLQIDKVTDLAGCANFILLAVLTLCLQPEHITARKAVISGLVIASRLQLGSYLLYRVLKRGKDDRFDEMRAKCLSFLGFWVFQMIWVFGVSAPVIFLNCSDDNPPLGALDYASWVLFVLGFILQMSADFTKNSFRAKKENSKKVCDAGVWKYSRHPNFCGEILMWWAVFMGSAPVFEMNTSGYATVVSPVLTMAILLFLSGIPTAEGVNAKRWYDGGERQQAYEEYFRSTPPVLLLHPCIYRNMPVLLKRVFCFEFPLYEYPLEAAPMTPLPMTQ